MRRIGRRAAPVQPIYLNDDASATLALLSGRADASFGPQAMAAWKVASRGQTKIVGHGPFRPVAVTTKKGNGRRRAAGDQRRYRWRPVSPCWQDGVKRARQWRFRRLIRPGLFIRRTRARCSGVRCGHINGDPTARSGFRKGALLRTGLK